MYIDVLEEKTILQNKLQILENKFKLEENIELSSKVVRQQQEEILKFLKEKGLNIIIP